MKAIHKSVVVALALTSLSVFADPSVTRIVARQQWPWSKDVRVEYLVTGAATPVKIGVQFYRGNQALDMTKFAESLTGGEGVTTTSGTGTHYFTFDPVKFFGTGMTALDDFSVKVAITGEAPASAGELAYRIFDLETGKVTDLTRADIMNAPGVYGPSTTDFSSLMSGFSTPLSDVFIWTGVTTFPGAKTTKLIMRRIPTAGQTFYFGTGDSALNYEKRRFQVKFTKDVWLSVFELTQGQYKTLMGEFPACNFTGSSEAERATLPVEKVAPGTLEGTTGNGSWQLRTPAEGSFLYKLRAKFGNKYLICPPTEAQWEFAAVAGHACNSADPYPYKDKFPNGLSADPSARSGTIPLGLENARKTDVVYGQQTAAVGSKYPNAYGLYDMLGNVQEWMGDYYIPDPDKSASGWGYDLTKQPIVDPTSHATQSPWGSHRVWKGNHYQSSSVRVTYRGGDTSQSAYASTGFRLSCQCE